ncbi:class I SAM-dependent methyltransferase [Bacillus infantis]|uniref:class I SAM-dependent methyltransferase n=1 Tax=Bacillus infantis TaxID=324767 RepID=UPI003CF5BA95
MGIVDFGNRASEYARSRNDVPNSLFDSLHLRNINFTGKKVADLGCGTGALTRRLIFRKADAVGIDPSEKLLQEAAGISRDKYLEIPYKKGTAENTGLDGAEYDMATVLRAWHWFDREEALREITRILKPKGHLIVADTGFKTDQRLVEITFDFLKKEGVEPKPAGSMAESSQRINGFPVEWFHEWEEAGFGLKDLYALPYDVHFTNEEWLDRVASLSYLADLSKEEGDGLLQGLKEELEAHYGASASHGIAHFCTIAILQEGIR